MAILTGSFSRTIDEKLRVAIPKELRDQFQDADGLSPGGVIYVAPGTDGSLALYTEEAFSLMASRLAAASPADRDARAYRRLFYSAARRVELDRDQGRIRIPAELAAHAQLGKEAVLLGVEDHIELWDAARWEAYKTEKTPQYDAIAEAAFDHPHSTTE